MSDAEDKAHLLAALEAHGRSFLDSFAPSDSSGNANAKRKLNAKTSSNKRRRISVEVDLSKGDSSELEEEEWQGIGTTTFTDESGDEDQDEGSENDDFEHTDDELVAETGPKNVVVFSEIATKKATSADPISKAQMKAFMSSKISKLSSVADNGASSNMKDKKEEEDDRTNAQNDALLHKLVYTKLLSGSMTTELDLTPAKRRKALAGRVLELAGDAKLGKGERLVRDAEKNKAAKRVREGISSKQKERRVQELEEAKNLGNYHPTLKKVFEGSSSTTTARIRDKGLGMGVGKFSNGSLRLSKDDVSKVTGEGSRGFSGRGGGGRGRGARGRGRGQTRKHK